MKLGERLKGAILQSFGIEAGQYPMIIAFLGEELHLFVNYGKFPLNPFLSCVLLL